MEDLPRDLIDRSIKNRDENDYLNSVDLPRNLLDCVRRVQNIYDVQLDDYPDQGYTYQVKLLWDFNRIWGIFDLGNCKGLFVTVSGVDVLDFEFAETQIVQFVWQSTRNSISDEPLFDETRTKGRICINPRESQIQGIFWLVATDGNADSQASCTFHGKGRPDPVVVPHCLEDIVEEWNRLPRRFKKETILQYSTAVAQAAYLPRDEEVSVRERLLRVLEDVQTSGNFMTSGKHDAGVIPGLHISNVGTIRLPISAEDARAMIQSCHMSPYGKGNETLVNESVRKSWELDAKEVSFQNPAWKYEVRAAVDRALAGLGLNANPQEVKAELYKVLIYEEGAFFLPHQDSEKADGMFGTLILSLPSEHEGGEVIASHRKERLSFESAPNSKFGFSWAAWYADVTHEVKPVTSGYRIVLVYNLIHRPSAALLAARNGAGELTRLLASWACDAEKPGECSNGWQSADFNHSCPPALVYGLEHQYTEAELSFARLKGADQVRLSELHGACQKADCVLYLANIEKSDMGETDCYGYESPRSDGFHEIQDVIETTLELSYVVNARGDVVGERLPFLDEMIVQDNIFERDPDEEDYEGYTGNEGAPATHFYKQTGALIIPKGFVFQYTLERLKAGQGDAAQILQDTHCGFKEQPNDQRARERLLQTCRVLLDLRPTSHATNIMQIALEIDDPALYGQSMVNQGILADYQITQLADIVIRHGIRSVQLSAVAFLKIKTKDPEFVLSFIGSVYDYSHTGALDKTEADAALHQAFLVVIRSLKVEDDTAFSHPMGSMYPFTYGPHMRAPSLPPDTVLKLVRLADTTKTDTTAVMDFLVDHVAKACENRMDNSFQRFLIPVALGLSNHVATSKRLFTAGEQRFISILLGSYVDNHVRNAPPPPVGWQIRTTISCKCFHCDSVRRFILDPHATTKEFPLKEADRKHIDRQLDKTFFATSTIRGCSPCILRVEKTQAKLIWDYVGWIKRARDARYTLDRLDTKAPLKDILRDQYNAIMDHPNLKVPLDLSPALESLVDRFVASPAGTTVPQKRPFGR
ncbi:hypothetical protein P170DRAFT_469455 [Aspergillus steynii IBT 23096]|uniref:Uncharacterized protein n=1 Tax=Aspergillus steynii IBT 23096 TaxID=1392250 RepID=A0A2I2GMA0_9EURO|nr:uncharacterized protein P170DRAFT_469455 [Aspergillus steynii IBT 23096]PLB53979.1 hypothetical protein P170DRAFT_469455 [Aspergillus steynii IBT 23096]